MNTSWHIAKHISGGSKESFSRFIVTIAIAANALSIAIMVIAICMVSGFTKEIREKVFGFWGHVQIRHFQNNDSYEEKPIIQSAKLYSDLSAIPGISNVAPYINKACIVRTKTAMEGIVVKGVDHQYDWHFLGSYIKEGRVPGITRDSVSRDILISVNTARRLEVGVEDALIVYFLPKDGGRPMGRRFGISGLYHTGLEEYDLRYALADMRVLQELNNWDTSMVGGYEVKIKNIRQLNQMTEEIYQNIDPELNAESIREAQPNIFDWLDLQVRTEIFALILMLLVALLNMTTALLILILDRTRMIGILKALGAGNNLIRSIFLYNALIILGIGLTIGNALGLGICWLQQQTGFIKLDESSYYFSEAPVYFDWLPVLGINLLTIVITLLVLILPSMLISKVSPLKAIRYD